MRKIYNLIFLISSQEIKNNIISRYIYLIHGNFYCLSTIKIEPSVDIGNEQSEVEDNDSDEEIEEIEENITKPDKSSNRKK